MSGRPMSSSTNSGANCSAAASADSPRGLPLARARHRVRWFCRRFRRDRQPQRQLTAFAETLARSFECAAVQLGETARQREADAEAAAADVRAVLGHLREHLENFL